jgi:uncharacterized protein (TIGR00375 family)
MIINADLHIHSPYTKKKEIENNFHILSINAKKKGLDIVATGDCLHPQWLKSIIQLQPLDEGTFFHKDILFILSSEVQTEDHIHHLLYFPDITSLYDFREQIGRIDVDTNQGRPFIPISSEKLANIAIDTSVLIGPSHIFDLFSGLYSKYDSLYECYGSAASSIYFIELGLGIDTYHADLIKELHHITFLTNSDTHNPHPIRLGREFTQFNVKQPKIKYLLEAIKRKGRNKPVLNAGIPPEEGKFFQSRCNKCRKSFTYKQSKQRKWNCICGGIIKKGIRETIFEKSTAPQYHYPYHRPLYLSLLPLHEILTKALHQQNPFETIVEKNYHHLISLFGNEIHIMLETPIENIKHATNTNISEMIKAFRMATFDYKKGGGGIYGTVRIESIN